MNNKLLERYTERQLKIFANPRLVAIGFIKADPYELLCLSLRESVFSLAQSIDGKNFEVWENWLPFED